MKTRLTRLFLDQRTLLLIYTTAVIVVTIQRGVFGFPNDYAIFRASFWNLIANRDLYTLRLDQAHDYFKYSPSFALLFAPFAVLPFTVGLFCWNLVNALAIFLALRLLLPPDQSAIARALVFLPMLRSMQSAQSNALVAALIVFAFVSYERGWLWRGATAVALGAVIKIFPLAAATFALPRRDRVRAILMVLASTTVLILLPLIVISPTGLLAQYRSWSALEKVEGTLVGSSAMALLRDAGIDWPAWPVQLLAAVIVIGVLVLRARDWNIRSVRLQFLGLVLVFCVVFNHRAERQSAVIALSGMVIWFLASPRSTWRAAFATAVYLLVTVTGSDLVPGAIKQILSAEMRFTIPLTALWLVMLGQLALPRIRAVGETG